MSDKEEVVLNKSQPSVSISKNAKGTAQFEVKAYADTMDEALAQAVKAFDELSKKYPG
jgi:hypothetical protein